LRRCPTSVQSIVCGVGWASASVFGGGDGAGIEHAVEGGAADAENFGGAEFVAGAVGEDFEDVALDDILQTIEAMGGCGGLGEIVRLRELEVVGGDDGVPGVRGRFCEDFAHLADVAGPAVLPEYRDGVGGEAGGVREAAEDGLGEGGEVFEALAEGWKGDLDGGDAAVELFVELAGGGEGAEILLAGGDDAEIAAGRPMFFVEANEPEQATLQGSGEAAEAMEEERAAVRLAESVHTLGICGKSFYECGGVVGDKGAIGADAPLVEHAGDGLLAGAALAEDEGHAHVRGDAQKLRADLLHGGSVADEKAAIGRLGGEAAAIDRGERRSVRSGAGECHRVSSSAASRIS
jgi:hypothetical protein